jgi:hypothetical protein
MSATLGVFRWKKVENKFFRVQVVGTVFYSNFQVIRKKSSRGVSPFFKTKIVLYLFIFEKEGQVCRLDIAGPCIWPLF